MENRYRSRRRMWLVGLSVACLAVSVGCAISIPSDVISSLILSPNESCVALAARLGLGPLLDASVPGEIGMVYQAFQVVGPGGTELSVWFVPAQSDHRIEPNPAGTMLMMHGTDGTIECALPWLLVAAQNHMNGVALDYQGFGASGGVPNLATLLDDSDAVLDWIVADGSESRQNVHLVGVSLGTGATLGLATLRGRPQIRSITLDSAYDPEAILGHFSETAGVIFPLLEPSARMDFPWLFEMRQNLGSMQVPAMFLHGTEDQTTPVDGARTMFDLAGSPSRTMWLFNGLQHVQALFLAEREYVSLVVTFWRNPNGTPDPHASETDESIHIPSFQP